MMRALIDAGERPDLLVGTSVGAINAGFISGSFSEAGVQRLEKIWRGLSRKDVFPLDFRVGLLGFVGKKPGLVDPKRLQSLVSSNLSFTLLNDAPIKTVVVATDLASGAGVVIKDGDATSAIVASASIPGVLPPVRREGRVLVDGGVADNASISAAVELGATEVWVLPAGFACGLSELPTSALAVVLHSISMLVHRRLGEDIDRYSSRVALKVVPPLCPLDVSPLDFSQSSEMIERAATQTKAWLAQGAPVGPDTVLLHSH